MKLYATINNEKGKAVKIGSNEFLEMTLVVGQNPIAKVYLYNNEGGDNVNPHQLLTLVPLGIVDDQGDKRTKRWIIPTKGKKEKDEKCEAIGCKAKATRYVKCLNDTFDACDFHGLNLPDAD